MGRTPKPLNIYVYAGCAEWQELADLRAQGHNVCIEDVTEPTCWDLILGPSCWRMDDAHRAYLKLAIQEARKRRYPNEKVESE